MDTVHLSKTYTIWDFYTKIVKEAQRLQGGGIAKLAIRVTYHNPRATIKDANSVGDLWVEWSDTLSDLFFDMRGKALLHQRKCLDIGYVFCQTLAGFLSSAKCWILAKISRGLSSGQIALAKVGRILMTAGTGLVPCYDPGEGSRCVLLKPVCFKDICSLHNVSSTELMLEIAMSPYKPLLVVLFAVVVVIFLLGSTGLLIVTYRHRVMINDAREWRWLEAIRRMAPNMVIVKEYLLERWLQLVVQNIAINIRYLRFGFSSWSTKADVRKELVVDHSDLPE
ncbi:hypothetical protein Tco_0140313 [Tanacetum coccineum]